MKNLFTLIILALFLSFSAKADTTSVAQNADTLKVYKINIKQEIGPASWRHLKLGYENAIKEGSDLLLIHMNTYGGAVDAADSMRTKILNSKIPVWVFIDNNAASAGALISIACDRIYMRPGGNIGAATVVNQSGEVVPDKYQSFMRSMMRSTAESHGKDTIVNGADTTYRWIRDPAVAEAMVDPSMYVEGISDTGKVLTFTTQEAIKFHYCEGAVENIEELMKLAQQENYVIKEYKPAGTDHVIDFLINPMISGILIMIIIGGIYFELQTPGLGFPSAAALAAAVLYFAPLYLEGLAANWEILIFVFGIVLVALEIFAIPGFGVAGVSGIILIVVGLTLSLTESFDFTYGTPDLSPAVESLFLVIVSFFLSIIGSIYLSKRLLTAGTSPLKRFVLQSSQEVKEGFVSVDHHYSDVVGKNGVAHTVLRPSGKVMVDNEVYDAKSEYGFIEKGTEVEVIRFEHGQLYVKQIRN